MNTQKNKNYISIIFLTLVFIFSTILYACVSCSNMKTADNVQLNKYMGKWFEIARIDTPFQRGKFDSQAEYKLNKDGTVQITNSAISEHGEQTSAKAVGYVPDSNNMAKLRVSFFRPFYSDYWILEVDKYYQWALVGTPNKKYMWILSRTPNIKDVDLMHILTTAKLLGFDTSKLLYNKNLKKLSKNK